MSKIAKKLSKLNVEQKLLFLATLIVPTFIFVIFLNSAFNEIYSIIHKILFPPTTNIDFSNCGVRIQPFYLSIIGIISILTLSMSSFSILRRNFKTSILFLVITLLIILTRILEIYFFVFQNFNKPSFDLVFYFVIEDLIFFAIVSFLFVWQFTIFYRIPNAKLS